MTGTRFVNRIAIMSRRKAVTAAVIYGLSLAVRFTSAAGEEVQIPAPTTYRAQPLFSVMKSGAQQPYQGFGEGLPQPIVFRHGWPLSSASKPSTPGCAPP